MGSAPLSTVAETSVMSLLPYIIKTKIKVTFMVIQLMGGYK
jgi:hypothetical protein